MEQGFPLCSQGKEEIISEDIDLTCLILCVAPLQCNNNTVEYPHRDYRQLNFFTPLSISNFQLPISILPLEGVERPPPPKQQERRVMMMGDGEGEGFGYGFGRRAALHRGYSGLLGRLGTLPEYPKVPHL